MIMARPEHPQSYGAPPDTSAVDTQVEVLRSQALAERVVRRLKLYNDPEFNGAMAPRFFGLVPGANPVAQPDARLVSRVASGLVSPVWVRRAGVTYVVYAGVSSTSPQKAARLTNVYMDEYKKKQLDDKIALVTKANCVLGLCFVLL